MDVYVQKTGKIVRIEHAGTAAALLERLGISPEAVLIVADGRLITTDEIVDGCQRIELLSVISGG